MWTEPDGAWVSDANPQSNSLPTNFNIAHVTGIKRCFVTQVTPHIQSTNSASPNPADIVPNPQSIPTVRFVWSSYDMMIANAGHLHNRPEFAGWQFHEYHCKTSAKFETWTQALFEWVNAKKLYFGAVIGLLPYGYFVYLFFFGYPHVQIELPPPANTSENSERLYNIINAQNTFMDLTITNFDTQYKAKLSFDPVGDAKSDIHISFEQNPLFLLPTAKRSIALTMESDVDDIRHFSSNPIPIRIKGTASTSLFGSTTIDTFLPEFKVRIWDPNPRLRAVFEKTTVSKKGGPRIRIPLILETSAIRGGATGQIDLTGSLANEFEIDSVKPNPKFPFPTATEFREEQNKNNSYKFNIVAVGQFQEYHLIVELIPSNSTAFGKYFLNDKPNDPFKAAFKLDAGDYTTKETKK